ncbi:MAG TPA: prephenate dehydrogenase/arogenate dehydrogenase family protein [Burkholderiales bacterium]|nr:prephenate dehydrogenase/arogenate dehydrogenase family protein [Burkholderiales bacterium]
MSISIQKLVVVGVGLIGGSFALALKAAGGVRRAVGVGRSRANLGQALAMGAIDDVADDLAAAVDGADFVLVTTPVGAMPDVFARIAPKLAPDAVVTDGGSTKQTVVAAARAALGARVAQFVPAHPIAGSDASGAGAATATLFRDREVILTVLPETAPEAVARVRSAWQACGARVAEMTPGEHDAVLAAVSHLPHLLSYALVHELAGRADATQLFAHAGTGLRDVTRLAASHPEMWRDICVANREALLGELRRYQDTLAKLGALLEQSDGAGLERLFEAARAARRAWTERSGR